MVLDNQICRLTMGTGYSYPMDIGHIDKSCMVCVRVCVCACMCVFKERDLRDAQRHLKEQSRLEQERKDLQREIYQLRRDHKRLR